MLTTQTTVELTRAVREELIYLTLTILLTTSLHDIEETLVCRGMENWTKEKTYRGTKPDTYRTGKNNNTNALTQLQKANYAHLISISSWTGMNAKSALVLTPFCILNQQESVGRWVLSADQTL